MAEGQGRKVEPWVRVPRGVWIAMIHGGLDSRLRGNDGWWRGNDGAWRGNDELGSAASFEIVSVSLIGEGMG